MREMPMCKLQFPSRFDVPVLFSQPGAPKASHFPGRFDVPAQLRVQPIPRERSQFPLPCHKALPQPPPTLASLSRAFFSFDAAFALLTAIFALFLFSLLASAASSSAHSQAAETSSSLLALRLSSLVMEEAAQSGGEGRGSYRETGKLDDLRLREFDLQEILKRTGRAYASISVHGGEGELLSSSAGTAAAEKFCASRLALLDGEIVRLEVCVS